MRDRIDISAALNDLTKETKLVPSRVIKDFNLLLNNRDHEIAQNISALLQDYHATTPLQKLLRTKLVNRYKVSSEVWVMLTSTDSLYVSQALKFDWFFSNNDDPVDFLQNILPKLAYSTRLKILNRYGSRLRDTAAGEAVYVGVKSRYGVSTAVLILPACSEPFVQNELSKISLTLPRHVMMALLDKYPTLSGDYVGNLVNEKTAHKIQNIDHYKCVFMKLTNKNFSTFVHLLVEHDSRFPYLSLGRRPLNKLLKNYFDLILKDCDKFLRYFSRDTFFRRLSLDQFKRVYASSLLPSKLSELFEADQYNIVHSCLEYLKPSVIPSVFTSAFRFKYSRDCTSEDLLLKFPSFWLSKLPLESRTKWIDAKISEMEISDQAKCIANLPCELSLPRLKKLLASRPDPKVREDIVSQMMKTLELNACPGDFKETFASIAKSVRNENDDCKSTLIRDLSYLKFLSKLDLDDWALVLEFMDFLNITGTSINYWYTKTFFRHILHACYVKKVDPDPYFRKMLELHFSDARKLHTDIIDIGNDTPFRKNCLEWFVNEIPNMEKEAYDRYIILHLLKSIYEYNKVNKRNCIEEPEWLMNDIENVIRNPDKQYFMESVSRAFKDYSSVLYERLLVLCFPNYAPCWVLCGFLKRNPDIILSNAEILAKNMVGAHFREYSYFYRKCRLYDSYGIPSELMKYSEMVLGESVREDMDIPELKTLQRTKSHAVQMLAFLQHPATYLSSCSKHTPLQQKIEEYSKEIQVEFAVQRGFCKSLTHITTPLETLSLLPQFTKGDYLKIVCGSLIGVSVKIPENVILPVLKKWIDCPVSLRKHILRLMYKIAPVEYSIAAIKTIFKTERNTSLRLVLFLQVRDSFISEATNDSYSTIISIIQQLKDEDKEILDKLLEINNIPDAYLSKYIKVVWELIDSEWVKNVLPNGKKTLIESIDKKLFMLLDNDVCDMILEYELSSKLPNTTLSKLVPYYLLNCSSDAIRLDRLEKVMALLGSSIITHWNDHNRSGIGWAFPIRHVISNATESLCVESLDSQDPARASLVLADVKKSLLSFVKPRDLLRESIQLDAYALYLALKGSGDESKYESALADLYYDYIHKLESQYGYALIDNLLSCEIPMVTKTKLAHHLLKNHSHPTCQILASVIAGSVFSEGEDMPMADAIINNLLASNIPDVQASAADYFKILEASIAMMPTEVGVTN